MPAETTTEAESFADDLDTLLLRHPSTPVGNVHRMLSDASAALRSLAARIQELEAERDAANERTQLHVAFCRDAQRIAADHGHVIAMLVAAGHVEQSQVDHARRILAGLTSSTEGEQHG